jgi:hypothetical protein
MEREALSGRATSAQYESFKNQELARIRAKCDTFPHPPCDDDDCGCPHRTLAFRETNGEWAFWEEKRNGDVNNCEKIAGADKLRFKVTAPEKALEPKRPFRFLTTVSKETVLPFENKYSDWQSKAFEVEMPDTCASIDCFVCPNNPQHNVSKDPKVCTPLREFLEKIERIKNSTHKFSAIVPGTTNVWLVRQDNTVEKVAAIESRWFKKDFINDKEKSKLWMSSLQNLALLATYDPNISISAKNIEAHKFIARVRIEGQSYELGVSPGSYYFPIEQGKFSAVLTRKLMAVMAANRQNQALWRKMLTDWLSGETESKIVDFIPSAWAKSENPMDAVGRQTTEEEINIALANALDNNEALDILMRASDGTHQIWRSGNDKPETIPQLEHLFQSRSRFTHLLALADPDLKILAENTDECKMAFIYKNNTNRVWSWVGPPKTELRSFALLKGETPMHYSGQPTRPYIARLMNNVSDSEKDFLIRFAAAPEQFQLIDWHPYSDDAHVLLYKVDGDEPQDKSAQKIHRLSSQNGVALPPMLFKTVNVSWSDISSCYTDWKKKILVEAIFHSTEAENVEVWLSQKGLGFSRKDGLVLLDVYPDASCGFIRISLAKVENYITEAVYKGDDFPDKNILFRDWLSNGWDKKNWRANPRGLLARN